MFAFVKIYQTMLTIANLRFFKLAKRPPMCTILLIKHCWKIIKLPDVYITFARNMIVTTYREIKRMRSRSLRFFNVYVGFFFSRASSDEQNNVIGTRKPTSIPTEGSKNAYSYSGCVCCLLPSGLCTEPNKVKTNALKWIQLRKERKWKLVMNFE